MNQDVVRDSPRIPAEIVRDETGRWAKVVKESGAKVD